MTRNRSLLFPTLVLSFILLAACGGEIDQPAQSLQTDSAPLELAASPSAISQTPATDQPPATLEIAAASTEAATDPAETTAVPTQEETVNDGPPAETPVPASTALEAVEVTAFTPAQQEGPYYPLEKPADQDNDLVQLSGAAALPAGQILEFGGTVYDAEGHPLEGIAVEIWQTDASGVYLHPNDPGTENRDRNFQFYGESQTGPDGVYEFRTIVPGLYEPRPRHIHVKVKRDGQELLTTQFYFAGEINLQGADALMLLDTRPDVDEAGNPILTSRRDIFLNISP
jgi:protocatechuate 3,4-dioxygenase beta subunit